MIPSTSIKLSTAAKPPTLSQDSSPSNYRKSRTKKDSKIFNPDTDKLPIVRGNTQVIRPIKKTNSLSNGLFLKNNSLSSSYDSINTCKFIESKLQDKLRNVDEADERTILKVYLEIFEAVITVDIYGPVLEKIRQKIVSVIEKGIQLKEEYDEQNLRNYFEENTKICQTLTDVENSKKSLEMKLKKLSLENIEITNELKKALEENSIWREFKKTVKLTEGTPDFIPLVKESKRKSSIIDSLNKRIKDMQFRERKYTGIIKLVKESGININELILNHRDRKSSSDSLNLSRLEMSDNAISFT